MSSRLNVGPGEVRHAWVKHTIDLPCQVVAVRSLPYNNSYWNYFAIISFDKEDSLSEIDVQIQREILGFQPSDSKSCYCHKTMFAIKCFNDSENGWP